MGTITPLTTLRVGLTGGIGAGKTTVANLFSDLGVPIIDADVIAHQLTIKNSPAYHHIVSHFGKIILQDNNDIDRGELRKLIFQNPTEKKWLENYLHPLIRAKMREAISQVKYPYCICVIPLLAESKKIDFIDRILVIDAPIEMQLARAKKRDATSQDLIQKIMDSQASQKHRLSIADDIIVNDGDTHSLENKVKKLHDVFLKATLK